MQNANQNKLASIVGRTSSWTSRTARVLVAAVILFPLISAPASAADNPKIKEALQTMKESAAALGKPKLEGDDLFFGTSKINGDYTIVDAIKTKHGANATFFAKKGTNYVRVSTNIMKDGQRGVGTNLDATGPAYAAISKNNSFYGIVEILGKFYDTGYEPIKSDAGETIGIYLVAFSQE